MQSANENRLLTVGLSAAGCAIFGGVFLGFLTFFSLSASPKATEEMVYSLFFFLFMFLFAGSVPFVASTLLQAGDYLLLSAAPVKSTSVVAAKLLDATVTNSLQFTVIGFPALIACAIALHFSLLAWILLPLVLALFVLMPALLTSAILLIALGVFGPKRVSGAISTVNIVLGAVVCLTIVSQIHSLPVGGMISFGARESVGQSSISAHAPISSWFAQMVLAMAHGNWTSVSEWMLGILSVTTLLFVLGMVLGGKLLGNDAGVEVGSERNSRYADDLIRTARRGVLRVFSSPVAAIIWKDMRYIVRDTVLPGQMAMPLILFLVPFVLVLQPSVRSMVTRGELASISMGMIVIVVYMQTSILSLTCIGLEGRSYAMLMNSPNHAKTILLSKFFMSTLVTSGFGLTLVILDAVILLQPVRIAAMAALLTIICCASLCGMGVGLSAALPRFTYENPAHRVSVWALVIGFFGSAAYTVVTTLSLGVPVYLNLVSGVESVWPNFLGAGIFILISVLFGLVPMIIGAERLNRYQWEH